MRLSRRIARQPTVRYTAACLFVGSAVTALLGLVLLGAPTAATIAIPAIVLLTAVPVAIAPTETMDGRWFHALPLIIVVEAGVTMWAVVPQPGVIAPIFVFLGALIVFLITTWRGMVVHLAVASAVMLTPVAAGASDLPSTLTILACIIVMWGFAVMTNMIWRHAEDAAEQLDELAQRDPLTGLGNRRMLDDRLEYELVRHTRSGGEMTLVVLDLNGFKAINDTLGHTAGDDLLRDVALALAGAVRAQDTVARPGGDEFCLIAPDTGEDAAPVLVDHIRGALGRLSAGGRPLEAGIGFAVFPQDGRRARQLFDAADARQRGDKPAERRSAPLVPAP